MIAIRKLKHSEDRSHREKTDAQTIIVPAALVVAYSPVKYDGFTFRKYMHQNKMLTVIQ